MVPRNSFKSYTAMTIKLSKSRYLHLYMQFQKAFTVRVWRYEGFKDVIIYIPGLKIVYSPLPF